VSVWQRMVYLQPGRVLRMNNGCILRIVLPILCFIRFLSLTRLGPQGKHISSRGNQRVVLLVGPHKTASTSQQRNIIRWIKSDNILPGWSWPAPAIDDDGFCGARGKTLNNRPNIFYSYITTLYGKGEGFCVRELYEKRNLTKEDFINDYEQEFRNSWSEGNNLIIASEAIDMIITSTDLDGGLLLTRILHGMPWNSHDTPANKLEGSNDDITVLVNFRAPRVKHLISMWHECCMDDISFQDYLTISVPRGPDGLRSIDSLQLVKVFLEKGIHVTLINMAGVSAQGYDISAVVACDVLNANCTSNMTIIGDDISPIKMNSKYRSHGMTDDQLEMIESIIRNYDCNFENITQHEKLTILYPDELINSFKECADIIPSDRILTRLELEKKLSQIGSTFERDIVQEELRVNS